ncbi:hypothetical protein ACHQM5_021449 [Ranunculus cassubicifolius]
MQINESANSSSKKRRTTQINEDRISTLPTPILHHILSYLDTKFVVQTSILSKTWQSIWISIPFLNFTMFRNYKNKNNFMDFVNKVLLFRDSSKIEKFRFYCVESTAYDVLHRIGDWIQLAVRCNVEVMNLNIRPEVGRLELPNYLFTCKSLVKVKLFMLLREKVMNVRYCGLTVLYLPGVVNLPNLRKLVLYSLLIRETEFMNKIFTSCPVLEKLVMINCGLAEIEDMVISAAQLKILEIDGFGRYTIAGSEEICKISIHAPNLISLVYKADIGNGYTLEHISSLVTADIDLQTSNRYAGKELVSGDYIEQVSESAINILQGVSNAKSLRLSASLLEVLPEPTGLQPTPFLGLRQLKLTIWLSRNCIWGIKYLLENSGNLETLFLEITDEYRSRRLEYPYCNEIQVHPTKIWEYWGTDFKLCCNFDHLKFIEIDHIRGRVNELEFLKVLLVRARALETLIIFTMGGHAPGYRRQLKKFCEELLASPRASSRVTIVVD